MTDVAQSPRMMIDFEQGAAYGDPVATLATLEELGPSFARFRQAWLFHSSAAPLLRGFYYPISSPERFGIPRGRGPRMVLIDENGDQLWLSGAGCGESGEMAGAARSILATMSVDATAISESGPSPVAGYDEMLFVDGILVTARPLTEPIPNAPPGKTFIRDGRIVCRVEYEKEGTTPLDLRDAWTRATESHGWLGRPTSLTLYENRAQSEMAGHEGCHLIATGQSRRELWLQFPEPDTAERLSPGAARVQYSGAFTEYDAIKTAIFHSVGVDIDPLGHRPWRDKILGRHRVRPDVVRWP